MSRQKTLADREQYVVKANELIRRTRYALTAQQQKIVLFAISKIKPGDDVNTEYTFDIKDFANACGIKIGKKPKEEGGGSYGGTYYDRIKEDIDTLTTRQWCHMPDGLHMTVSWIGDAKIHEGDATITIRFNPYMQPYLFDLKEKYTQYKLINILAFRGKHAIRLYEILRSYMTQSSLDDDIEKNIMITLEEFRSQFDLTDNYSRWADIDRYVLKPAVKEINNGTDDIHVEYEPMRGERTRAIEKINFIVTRARAKQMYTATVARKERLDHKTGGGTAKK